MTRPASAAAPRRRSGSSEESDSGSVRIDLEFIDVDVDAMEAREQDEAVGAGRVELFGEMRERGEERRQLDGDRDAQAALHLAHDLDRLPFDVGGARRHVAGGVIDVQLEAVRAGLLEQSGVGGPSARRDAVERRHAPGSGQRT